MEESGTKLHIPLVLKHFVLFPQKLSECGRVSLFLYKTKIDTPRYNQPDLLLLSACTIFAKQIK